MYSTIPGMETVVASVSGYHGSERFKLIKLISRTGASYVGTMSRSITHLVCWKFEGEKYVLAKKFRVKVVNHQWVEDCIKQGRLIPEGPYMLQSGREVGPLSLQDPISDKLPLNKNGKVLSDISNVRDEFRSKRDSEDTAFVSGSDPVFLNKDLFSGAGENKDIPRKSKLRKVGGSSNQQDRSRSRKRLQDPPFGLPPFRDEDSSLSCSLESRRGKRMVLEHEELQTHHVTQSFKGKRNSSDDLGVISMIESSQKGRRRLKKYDFRKNTETIILDSDEESCPVQPHGNINIAAPAYTCSGSNLCVNQSENEGTSYNNSNGPVDDTEHVRDENNDFASIRSTSCPESTTPLGSPSEHPPLENSNMKTNDVNQLAASTRVEASAELSCVICLIEFSATRGVLQCGHRFCYSCILDWARYLDSIRKPSTCPLCKEIFVKIMKVEDADCSDQKIYSQTIPSCAFLTTGGERQRFGTNPFLSSTYELTTGEERQSWRSCWGCTKCREREPEDLLVKCHVCEIQVVHSYCLDPYVVPWTCPHCRDLQSILRRSF